MPRKRFPAVFVVFKSVLGCDQVVQTFTRLDEAEKFRCVYGNEPYFIVRYRFSTERMHA